MLVQDSLFERFQSHIKLIIRLEYFFHTFLLLAFSMCEVRQSYLRFLNGA